MEGSWCKAADHDERSSTLVESTTADIRSKATRRRSEFSLDRSSTMAEWLDHPVGYEVLNEALRRSPLGDLTPMLENPDQLRMLGSFPLSRLATMLGDAMDSGLVDDLLARVEP